MPDSPHCAAAAIIRQTCSYSASDSAYSYTFLSSVVCLSVVCHICASCLSRSTNLDAIWPIHLWTPMTHHVRLGSLPPKERENLGSNPQPKDATGNSYAATRRIQTSTWEILPFAKLLWSCSTRPTHFSVHLD